MSAIGPNRFKLVLMLIGLVGASALMEVVSWAIVSFTSATSIPGILQPVITFASAIIGYLLGREDKHEE